MSPLICIASCMVIWLLLYFLVLSPLRFLCSMHPPCFMLPSVCLMLTFPVTPRLALIVLQVPIRLVVVFKSLVFTHVPQFEYCLLLFYPICLTLLSCVPLWVPQDLVLCHPWNPRTHWCKWCNLRRLKPKFSCCTKSSCSCPVHWILVTWSGPVCAYVLSLSGSVHNIDRQHYTFLY